MKNLELIEWLKDAWVRISHEDTPPFFKKLRVAMIVIFFAAGGIWFLHETELMEFPEKLTTISKYLTIIATAIGVNSSLPKVDKPKKADCDGGSETDNN